MSKKIQVCDGSGKDHFDRAPDTIPVNVFSCLNMGPDGFEARIVLEDAELLLDDLHNIEYPQRDVRIIVDQVPYTATAALLVGHLFGGERKGIAHADISVSKVNPR